MAALRNDLTRQHAQHALMTAMRVSDKCLALRRVAISINQIFQRAKTELPLTSLVAWAGVAADLLQSVDVILARADDPIRELRTALSAPVTDAQFKEPYRLFVFRARTTFPQGRQPARLDLLLIALLCTAAGAEGTLAEDLAAGMRQAYKAIAEDSRNHWRAVADQAPLNIEEVDELLKTAKVEVVRDFLQQVRTYLSTQIIGPKAGLMVDIGKAQNAGAGAVGAEAMGIEKPGTPTTKPTSGPSRSQQNEHSSKQETFEPSIAAALRDAQLAPIAAKAGVGPQWNSLIPDALAKLTAKLSAELVAANLKRAVISVLALVSLLVAKNPKATRLLHTCFGQPMGQVEIWLDVEHGWICWWQRAYTDVVKRTEAFATAHGDARLYNVIPLPEALAKRIRELHAAAGEPAQFQTSLDLPLGPQGLLMSDVNAMLKELGDPVHLAEPTRFASSAGLATIQWTGSDLAAGHLTHFDNCAISAPFYFSPRTDWLAEFFTELYKRLGLGSPVSMEGAPQRQGAGKSHEVSMLRSGFERLIKDIVQHSRLVQSWSSDEIGITAIGRLAPLCAELFHIPIGGRGSAPERISIGSVTAGRNWFVLMDKLTDGERSARLLPHTKVTMAAVRIFRAARQRAEQQLGMTAVRRLASEQPLFATIELAPSDVSNAGREYRWKPIDAAAISAMATEYFGADLNFQRSILVTELGEAYVNRWLIRSMTGHGSYLTHAFAPSMSVAPAEALELLRPELEKAVLTSFGGADLLERCSHGLPESSVPPLPIGHPRDRSPSASAAPISSDPLQALGNQCLIDWRFVEETRQHLAAADGSASADVELLLSALAFSGTPTVELALDVVLDPASLKHEGPVPGVIWRRQHYVHDLWLPLQRPTRLALQHRGPSAVLGRSALIAQAAQYLRSRSGYHGWPSDDFKTLVRFQQACEAWRRVEFPPYLCALALPWQQSACLSHRSIHRLATGGAAEAPNIKVLSAKFKRGDRVRDRVHGLTRIQKALQSAATDTDSKGRLIRRGQVLNTELDKIDGHGSAIFHFLLRVYRREAFEMVNDLDTANDASSAATRFSALWPTFEKLPWDKDPDDFQTEDLVQIVEDVNAHCLGQMVREDQLYTTTDGAARSSRAHDALQRLFNVLSRDGFEIPDEAWQAIGGAIVYQPRISASSTVLFDADIESICESTAAALIDEPLLAQRQSTKIRTMAKAPLRLGEASCLPYDCITELNALAIATTDFGVDKTKHAPRLIQLENDLAELIKDTAKVSRSIAPGGKWIFRFDDDATQDDVRCNRLLAELIRLRTGEPFARPQSLRANAYQELLWPGWRSILTSFLGGETSAPDCLHWIRATSAEKRWTCAIGSAVAAGHGAVDPGLLHYAGAWALIYAVHYEASLTRTPPGHGWFDRLKLAPESMERARRRAGNENFDPWRWLESGRYDTGNMAPLYEPTEAAEAAPTPEGPTSKPPGPPTPPIHSTSAIVYLVLRALGLNTNAAAHESAIAGRVQEFVEPYRMGRALIADARKRTKQHQQTEKTKASKIQKAAKAASATRSRKVANTAKRNRFGIDDAGLNADIDLVLENQGRTVLPIVQWSLALTDAEAQHLDALFRRDKALIDFPHSVRTREVWQTVTRGMPSLIRLQLRFGRGNAFLTPAEEIAIRREGDPWFLGPRHPDRGQLPDLMIRRAGPSNDVLDRRMTSVVRLILLARLALNRAEAGQLKLTSGTSVFHPMPIERGSSNA